MASRLIDLALNLKPAKVVLVGDFMLDRYIFGSTDRISPEAPIPILRFVREEDRLGGAGFVLAGLGKLGARVFAVGVVGDDNAGKRMADKLRDYNADTTGLIVCNNRPTVEKVRLLGSSEDRTAHQMLRLDIEQTSPVDIDTENRLFAAAENAMQGADVLCLEDYNKGVLTESLCKKLIAFARSKNIPVLIDPARLNDYGKYSGASLIKLNRPETERATGLPAKSPEHWPAAADKLLAQLDLQAVVLTLNDRGCYLATQDGDKQLLPSRPRQVADATGAGDMVLVALCMAQATGATWSEAVEFANVVGGLEVEKLGCVPITREEIVADIMAEHYHTAGKERSLAVLLPEIERQRKMGRKIVFTNGCFDLIHLGHVEYFRFAKQQGDVLVVGVNTDSSIRKLKGEKRPVVNENDRVGVLSELESIDYLIKFDDDTPQRLIQAIQPDVLVKGADYNKEQVVGWDIVEARGGKVALAPLIDGRSTSNVIKRILDAYGNENSR